VADWFSFLYLFRIARVIVSVRIVFDSSQMSDYRDCVIDLYTYSL